MKTRIALLVPALAVMVAVACLWPSDAVLYSILGCVIAVAVAATWWEMRKIRQRQTSATKAFAHIRDYWGYPPKSEQVVEEVLPCEQAGWDFSVHIHEGAEQYLGAVQFSSLVERFRSISGVEDCRHEDRELFLIRTKSLTADTLREACWGQFMQAASAVYANDKS